MLYRRLVLALVAVATAGGSASASDLEPAMQAYIASPARAAAMAATVRRMLPLAAAGCRTARPNGPSRTRVYEPLTFDEADRPVAGRFQESIPVDLCGETVVFNIMATAHPNGEVTRINLLPGMTRADATLQRDALGSAYKAATKGRTCRFPGVRTTQAGPVMADGRWSEQWEIVACGERVPVTIQFIPRPDRTDFVAVRADEAVAKASEQRE